mmetsp:Transcript_35580/g.75977  ORF Transcript_35580/g.75977 Transcript_35580/m.75977 type:complete len:247 (+) Transcript_35580:1219-1959(+)
MSGCNSGQRNDGTCACSRTELIMAVGECQRWEIVLGSCPWLKRNPTTGGGCPPRPQSGSCLRRITKCKCNPWMDLTILEGGAGSIRRRRRRTTTVKSEAAVGTGAERRIAGDRVGAGVRPPPIPRHRRVRRLRAHLPRRPAAAATTAGGGGDAATRAGAPEGVTDVLPDGPNGIEGVMTATRRHLRPAPPAAASHLAALRAVAKSLEEASDLAKAERRRTCHLQVARKRMREYPLKMHSSPNPMIP